MPSRMHEVLILLFRNRPDLAPELLREALQIELPAYTQARIESADLTDVQPAEYRADLVVLLYDEKPVLGIVVEVQLAVKGEKRFAWPAYAAGLRARMRCPVCVLVVTARDSVARWAARPIELGPGSRFTPMVLGPSGVPIVVDPAEAAADPELAVLSAMAHGSSADTDKALQIAIAAPSASLRLDQGRSVLYFDLMYASLSEAVRRSVRALDPAKYEFQSEFALRFLAQGRAEGRAEGEAKGRADTLLKLMTLRFGTLAEAEVARIRNASIEELDRWTERVLSAEALADVLR